MKFQPFWKAILRWVGGLSLLDCRLALGFLSTDVSAYIMDKVAHECWMLSSPTQQEMSHWFT